MLPIGTNRKKRKTTNICQNFINKNNKWKYTNLNPQTSQLGRLINLHEPNTPIMPQSTGVTLIK